MAKKQVGHHLSLDAEKGIIFRDSSNNENDILKLDAPTGVPRFTRKPKVLRLEFDRLPRPLAGSLLDGGAAVFGAPTGAAGDENILIWPDGSLEYHILGTQTILAPSMVATGLDITCDDVENDGLELCPGILASNADAVFTVGTDPAFYMECKLAISDVSDFDDLAVGFRKLEAYQANVDDYDEMAALNVISGDVKIETILNGAGTTTTDTTDNVADGATVSLKVLVSAAGVVTYQIDDAAPTTVAAFTFDDAEVVVPFIYFLKAASPQAGTIVLHHLEVGLQ